MHSPPFMHAAVPDNLTATERRPTNIYVKWTAPPSPFSGNYRLTYGPLGGKTTSTPAADTSYNISGLQPFTNYMVTIQANNDPVVESGPPLSGVFATLLEATVPPGEELPSINVPQIRAGSSAVVEIVISAPTFVRQVFLR